MVMAVAAHAQKIELVKSDFSPMVFGGKPQEIEVRFRNPSEQAIEVELKTRLFQLSSGSAMPHGEAKVWKKLKILPKQTVVESYPLTLPEIKAPTIFRIEWDDLDKTAIHAYPADLLKRLQTLAGEKRVGVFDPADKLRTLFKKLKIDFADLEMQPEHCPLAIAWTENDKLPESIEAEARKGMAVVWVRPKNLRVSLVTRSPNGTIAEIAAAKIAEIATSAEAQVALVQLAELLVQPGTN